MRVGKVIVGNWTGTGSDRHLELKVYPTAEPVLSGSGKSHLLATESVRLPNGDQLAVNLYTPITK